MAMSYHYLTCRRGKRLGLRDPSQMAQALGGWEPRFPVSGARALTLQEGQAAIWPPSSGHRQEPDGRLLLTPGGAPLSPGFLLLPVTLLKALETGGRSLWQGTLETILINPLLGKRPCIKVQDTLSSAQVASFLRY